MSAPETIAALPHHRQAGRGWMGEVYRATDTKLGREVAIKILPASFARDPARMARFEREAKVLASLNHPHIAQIYGIEEGALVMELVEGPTLGDRIRQGAIPLEEALPIARQIADGVEAAHEKGIVHRDLKPGNVKIRPDGVVKVLDFGLAKVNPNPSRDRQGADDPENSPTLTMEAATRLGTILGTAAYMSPEQARGREVDKRADIWAFGCVLYEMVTGKRAFTGESTADILAAVVKTEPDLARAPAKVRRVLRRCLEKDPKKRLRDIGDVWELLQEEAEERPEERAPLRSRLGVWLRLAWAVSAVLAIIAAAASWVAWRATRPVDHPLTRLSVDLGPEAMTGLNLTVAISPDGRRLVYPARGPDGKQLLATRLLDQAQPTLLPGTENGRDQFFSPDGQWIGFFAGGQLKKISIQGGAPVMLSNAVSGVPMGASWGQDGNIVAPIGNLQPLSRIPSAGGPGRYLPSGHLVYVHQGVLFGVKFDPAKLQAHGSPVPLLEDVAANPATGGGQFDFSSTGTFAYVAGKSAAQAWQVTWLDSSGKMQPLLAAPGLYTLPRLSPDGKKLAFTGDGSDIYVYDLERDATSRLTFSGHGNVPVWAPDGNHIVFQSGGNGFRFFWVRSDGAGEPQEVLESPNNIAAFSFSPDGRWLAYLTSCGGESLNKLLKKASAG